MSMTRIIPLCLCVMCCAIVTRSQDFPGDDSSNVWQERDWETVFEYSTQDAENPEIVEDVARLRENPLDINTASAEDLCSVPGITTALAHRIIDRREMASFPSVEDLLTIDGITPRLYSHVRQFLTVASTGNDAVYKASFRSRISTDVEERKGYRDGSYPGSPSKVYNSMRALARSNTGSSPEVFSECEIGAVTSKDPGEKNLADFSAGFLRLRSEVLATSIIVGDYTVEAAEGLIFWRASAFAKGGDVIGPTRKNGGGIRPYCSTDENRFLRGAGATVQFGNVQVSGMYSSKFYNASMDSLSRITSFDVSGLFRTETELRKRNSTKIVLTGCRATAIFADGLKAGGTAYNARLANPLLAGAVEDSLGFRELSMQGIDVSYTNKTLDLFCECARGPGNQLAIIQGAGFAPTNELALSVVLRKYPPRFQSIYGFGFGDNSGKVENEEGLYVGVRGRPLPDLTIASYYDMFRHPQPTTLMPLPTEGNDFLILIEDRPEPEIGVELRVKRSIKPSFIDAADVYGRAIRCLQNRRQTNYRLTVDFVSTSSVNLSSRVEWMNVTYGESSPAGRGLLVSQSVRFKPFRRFAINFHAGMFQTDSYDSRIYEYERDVPGTSMNPALFGRGVRWYIVAQYHYTSHLYLSAKYSQTVKEGISSIGSGLDEIQGDTQSRVSVQVDVRL
jgi:hypothetical protein